MSPVNICCRPIVSEQRTIFTLLLQPWNRYPSADIRSSHFVCLFLLQKEILLTCNSGQWDRSVTCDPIDCHFPDQSHVLYAEFSCPKGTTFLKQCFFSCIKPAKLQGMPPSSGEYYLSVLFGVICQTTTNTLGIHASYGATSRIVFAGSFFTSSFLGCKLYKCSLVACTVPSVQILALFWTSD